MTDTLINALITGLVAAALSSIVNIIFTIVNNKKQLAKLSAPQLPGVEGQAGAAPVAAGTEKIEVLRETLLNYIFLPSNKEEEALKKAIQELKDVEKMESLVRIAMKSNSFKAFMTGAKKELNMK